MPDSIWNDKSYVLAEVKKDGRKLYHASPSLKKDKDVVLAAVKKHGRALQYADESLKKDLFPN